MIPITIRDQRLGLICNPEAGSNRRDIKSIREVVRTLPHTLYEEAVRPAEIAAAIDVMAAADIDLLAINGGDGTIHMALTHLLNRRSFRRLPRLLLIPGGTTNMTAHDLGISGRPLRILRRLHHYLDGSNPFMSHRRPVLRVDYGAGEPLYGMFFGNGVIASGVDYFDNRVRRFGLIGEKASVIAVVRSVLNIFRRRASGATRMRIHIDHDEAGEADYLFVMVTALDRLLLGVRLYWGAEPAPLHCTAIRVSAQNLYRALPALVRGKAGSAVSAERGYRSHNAYCVKVGMDGPFVIDGQVYQSASVGGTIQVAAAEESVEFLSP